jgi:hypothetical protein
MRDDEPDITPRADSRRALTQAIERVDEAIECGRAAADYADDAFGTLSRPSLELADLIGTLRVWYAAACDVLEEIESEPDRPGEQGGVQSPKTPRTTNPGDPR